MKSFKLGIAGLGTVGCGVIDIVEELADSLAQKSGKTIEIKTVSAQSKDKERAADISKYEWADNPLDMADDSEIDCIIEVIGGSEGIAKELIEKALANGKAVVSANKALIAYHGPALAELSEEKKVFFGYEAAVAGGIPAVKVLRESLAGNDIQDITAILNGTCNYILSVMRGTGREFDDVLQDAQDLGYAEADPSFDIDGVDAAHKLSILASIAFGRHVDFESVPVAGIRGLDVADISYAEGLGYKVKLLGLASRNAAGRVSLRVEPCLVPEGGQMASVEGVFNAVIYDADPVDRIMLVGRGAGAGPTASAVVSDILDAAQDKLIPVYGCLNARMEPLERDFAKEQMQDESSFYLRLKVIDQPGVVADVTSVLKAHDISISALSQHGRDPGQPVDLIFVTHFGAEGRVRDAVAGLSALPSVLDAPVVLRIQEI